MRVQREGGREDFGNLKSNWEVLTFKEKNDFA